MIVGTGVDVAEVERIRRSLQRYGSRFTGKIFTAAEIAYCEERRAGAAQSYAARFAAKEAAAKALGTGMGRGVTWQEIEVRRLPGHAPALHLTGRAAERAAELGVRHMHVSLTHTGQLAVAMVHLED